MDSGSADLWVGAEQCQDVDTGADCVSYYECDVHIISVLTLHILYQGKHTFLGSQSSSSFVDTKQPFQVTYGSGAVAGDIITDNINVAGLALNKHTFGVATQETDQFANDATQFDGLMGLAQSVSAHRKLCEAILTFCFLRLYPSRRL